VSKVTRTKVSTTIATTHATHTRTRARICTQAQQQQQTVLYPWLIRLNSVNISFAAF
jgi:alpha-D-ribose 1-methylphosphonate 5-phosphate C-P lyase